MAGELSGLKVAVLATDGVEQVELDRPWQALEEAGAEPVLVSLDKGTITAYDHIDKGDTKKVDATVGTADPDGVLDPGTGDQPPGEDSGQRTADAASDGHAGNRSAPVCALFGPRVAGAAWQEN